MTYLYSAFSHVLWPIYVPFAMGILEAVRWRKRATESRIRSAVRRVGAGLLHHCVSRSSCSAGVNLVLLRSHSESAHLSALAIQSARGVPINMSDQNNSCSSRLEYGSRANR